MHARQNDVQLTKDILKKIHGQFRSQIDEISKALEEDRRGWQKHNETILNSWERMQGTMGAAIKESRQIREKGEGDVVDLLERVIDKIRIELME